ALAAARVLQPKVPVIANVTAEPVSDPTKIRELLVEQVTGMVRWVDSVKTLERLGVTRMIEIGHGNVLSGLIKRISPEMSLANVSSVEDIAAVTRAA
ncbi:MAG: ACP S-malonyltransferase, partial [Alphaproteobacteria bacterium]